MLFDGWPNIQDECPVCHKANCASYRGYYQRNFFCTELEFVGPLVIRTGYCKNENFRFSLIPSFVIAHRMISEESTKILVHFFKKHNSVSIAVDLLNFGLGDEFYLPLSTAYKAIQWWLNRPP